MKKNLFLLLFLFFSSTILIQAQNDDWDWGSEPDYAREQWVILIDDVNTFKVFKEERLEQSNWLLENVPSLTPLLYTYTQKLYEGLLENATEAGDNAKVAEYSEAILNLFDKKIEVFGDEAYTLNEKGLYTEVWQEDPEKTQELYELYHKIVDLNGNETYNYNLFLYMYYACEQKYVEAISDEEILGIYNHALGITEEKIAEGGEEVEDWEYTKEFIEEQLTSGCVDVDCETLASTLRSKFEESKTDETVLKSIFQTLAGGECLDQPLLQEVALALYDINPSDQLAKVIALIYKRNGDDANYIAYLEKMEDKTELAKVYLSLAASTYNKNEARSLALQAAQTDPSLTARAYTIIGNLYMNSYSICATGDQVQSRACFLAAYDMYAKAGNASGMARAQQQFPSSEDIFTLGLSVGSPISVGCWIGGSTTLRTR